MSKLIAMFVTLVLMAAPTVVLANEHEEHGDKKAHTEDGTHLTGRMPVELAGRFADYWVKPTGQH